MNMTDDTVDPLFENFLTAVRRILAGGDTAARRKVVQTSLQLQKILSEG